MILLDTKVLSEPLRPVPDPAVLAWAAGVAREETATTAVTEAEIRYGLALLPAGARRNGLSAAVERLFAAGAVGRVLPFDREAARPYAAFVAARRAAGRPVAMADAMIAAIARAHGADAIATRNGGDFEGCGVRVLDPWRGAG